jgi:uncharacterized protein (TIGR00297 family)
VLPTLPELDLINPSQPEARVLPALLITSAFGLLGFLSHGVTLSGAVSGTLVAFLIYLGLGLGGFVTLFLVFALTWLTTRIGYSRKRHLGLAEDRSGRSAGQVLANLAAAALFAILSLRFGPLMAIGSIAALAEAAADTASSEIGEALSLRAWLITNLKPISPGQNGGISIVGTFAGILAALLVGFTAFALHVVSSPWIVTISGVLGTLIDSWLGATVERQGWIGNNVVNLASTLAAALIAIAIAG